MDPEAGWADPVVSVPLVVSAVIFDTARSANIVYCNIEHWLLNGSNLRRRTVS